MHLAGPAFYALLALAAVVLLFLASWGHLRFWSRRLALPLPYASVEEIETPDGAIIELRRVPLAAELKAPGRPPVLLVHGLGANHRNQDLHPDFSLARYLAARGRDVWLLTLRSGRRARSRSDVRRVRFAAMAEHDLPIGVRAVLERTGAPALDYVGFSMGGMLLYAALGRSVPESLVRRAVIVGSPGRVGAPVWARPLLRFVPRWMIPTLRFRLGAQAIAFASEWLRTPLHGISVNPKNLAPGMTRAALVNLVEDVPGPLNADFVEWARDGGEIRAGGAPVLEGLSGVATPALFLAGTRDNLAPIASVRRAFDAWGRDRPELEKHFVAVGRAHGHGADYGHGDLAIGAHAGADLFEPITAFLAQAA